MCMNAALTYCVNCCCSEIVSSEEAEQKLPAVPWRSAAASHACCCSRLSLAGQELPRNTAQSAQQRSREQFLQFLSKHTSQAAFRSAQPRTQLLLELGEELAAQNLGISWDLGSLRAGCRPRMASARAHAAPQGTIAGH